MTDQEFIERIVARLNQSADSLEPVWQEQLDTARNAAVTTAKPIGSAEELNVIPDGLTLSLKQAEQLPENIQHRLDQARQTALAKITASRAKEAEADQFSLWQWLLHSWRQQSQLPMRLAATACLTLTVATVILISSNRATQLTPGQELTLIASAEDLELYENLDFYLWLEDGDLLD